MLIENNYAVIIAKIKTEIETARLKAAISVNQHLLTLYWKIGTIILQQQNVEGWGTKVIERLSDDLRREFPDMKGTSVRNLKYMRAFAEAYPELMQEPPAQLDESIVQQPAAQIPTNSIVQPLIAQIHSNQFVQPPVAQIPWAHNVTILDRIKSTEERLFYVQKP